MPQLVLQSKDGDEATPLGDGPCVVGRLASCGLTLANEPSSSRKHFRLLPQGSRWVVEDLGSRNGTYLNEERLTQPRPLRHGDVLRVGETRVQYDCQAPVLAEGLELGNVILGRPRGRSDYGRLYEGRQPSLDRDVVVEVLDPDLAADSAERARYQQRARDAGAFEHAGIVAVFDVAATEQAVYTVFEAFPARDLEERLELEPLASGDALTVLRLTSEALHHVHGRQRVHGMLTPRAILLESDTRSKLTHLGESPNARLEPHRQRGLELALYASPEEARGQELRPASDIYSLGLIACRALCGQLPLPAQRREQALAAHAAPEELDLSALDLEHEQLRVLALLLAKAPESRPEAREAVAHFLDLGGGGALSASSAMRRRKAAAPGPAPAAAGPVKRGSARVGKGSARVGKGSARQAKPGSATPPAATTASAARKGSARQAGPDPTRASSARRRKASAPVVRRVSDREQAPEPAWALPVRLSLVLGGYALMFAATFLLARIVLGLLG